ncbi:SMC-Scp complex subunit ScpB [Alkalicoccobacillus murimartini]|uniref:Segregation and condensation protein B n=1 Tax=Alkalicoccobacillus murimartini TaxID=171685 RepID=A0ABT9YFJ4_9BACI|nr:SMC-Scp complex subunit ScpB [Alkalicoccobacillus murimartini]MDQ0205844.1 segregation and condensation protein B [Alkalicoccobacillus murimartini]
MKKDELQAAIEGLLFVTGDEGLTYKQLSEVLELPEDQINEAVVLLKQRFSEADRGLQVIETAGILKLATLPEHSSYFKKLASSPIHSGLSRAALETLAIVAYKQPITRLDIDEVRGVKSEKSLQSLISKLLVTDVGRVSGTGRAILYGTTSNFLDHFGLTSLEELPPLKESEDDGSIEDEADLFFEKMSETEWNHE